MLKAAGSNQMNLADPELELVDPTPNVHNLFVHFDSLFFWTALAGRALVRWSKKMYSCAGVCSYEGRNGICDIALSEPLLKLRPRKDLIETLLHEMIHAFLFITNRDNDRDGHGPNFQAHMHRINKAAGLNISIYHDFHDEVELYLRHWWRCNGPCQRMRPYFGVVRRSVNRAPGPSDAWWNRHKRSCGGTFIKIKEPEKDVIAKKPKENRTSKPKDGMTQKVLDNFVDKPKDSNKNIQVKKITPPLSTQNGNTTLKPKGMTQKVLDSFVDNTTKDTQTVITPLRTHTGNLTNKRKSIETDSVVLKVRDVWAHKQLPTISPLNKTMPNKQKAISQLESPPKKMKKIDDYFKASANSLLKELYGNQIEVCISSNNDKLTAVTIDSRQNTLTDVKEELVECPNCSIKVSNKHINTHLDECLNREIIERLTKDAPKGNQGVKTSSNDLVGSIQEKPSCEDNNVHKKQTESVISKLENNIKTEPSTSKDIKVEKDTESDQNCPCCGKKIDKPIVEHLDECLAFFNNNTTVPVEGNSSIETIIIDDDDDQFDETLTFNATGTKSPCPCCMKMIEIAEMNDHLDVCLNS